KGDLVVVIFHDHGTRYLGKMFNDDWMRDRHFLQVTKPRAVDMVANHKHLKLLTVNPDSTVAEALDLMNQYNVSQIPVAVDLDFIGSLNEGYIFNKIIKDPEVKNNKVKD